MRKSVELACAHSIIVCAIFLGAGFFGVAGWLPPVAADMDAAALAQMFAEHRTRIQIGLTMFGFSGMFYLFFAAAIATQMQRIEGEHHPLTRIQMAAGLGTALAIMGLAFVGLAMCFRPDPDPRTLQLANDFLWLVFVGFYAPGVAQNAAIGLSVLIDERPPSEAIYPRWIGYLNFWVAVSFAPGLYIAFFRSGPFAWHGVLGFWLVAVGFFAWAAGMWWATVRAIKRA